jgi:hypothetical protein
MDTMETLLVSNVLNEVLRGVPRTRRVKALLEQRSKLERIDRVVRSNSLESWTIPERRIISECIETVIEELGEGEFETRVGAEIDWARTFAKGRVARLR